MINYCYNESQKELNFIMEYTKRYLCLVYETDNNNVILEEYYKFKDMQNCSIYAVRYKDKLLLVDSCGNVAYDNEASLFYQNALKDSEFIFYIVATIYNEFSNRYIDNQHLLNLNIKDNYKSFMDFLQTNY